MSTDRDVRPDTSSGRSHDGWSFLNHGTAHASASDAQVRSQPPSSYLRSDRSSISPSPRGNNTYNGSRSSFSRNIPSASTGARSTTTIPSQPVLSRINSANACNHNHRSARRTRRPIKLDTINGLPKEEEFSIQAILSAIKEDIEGDLNTISEILGRSRFMLADQYESQMPPQGEITMPNAFPGVNEVILGNEPVHADDVLILHEVASLVEGSNTSSRAYRLMERLQAVPRPIRMQSDAVSVNRAAQPAVIAPVRTHSSPAVIQEESEIMPRPSVRLEHFTGSLRAMQRTAAGPVLSSNTFAADADVAIASGSVSSLERGEHDIINTLEPTRFEFRQRDTQRRAPYWLVPDLTAVSSWFNGATNNTDESAEARLRSLLNR